MQQTEFQLRHRLHGVDALRGIAAASVTLFHLTRGSMNLPTDNPVQILGNIGYLGVAVFFVISGFIVPYSLAAGGYAIGWDSWAFFKRRIVRIEPAYLCSVLLTIGLWYASTLVPASHAVAPQHLGWQLLLHVGYLVPWWHEEWLQPVYWSLAIEFQYYLGLLVCAPALLSRDFRIHQAFLVACLIVGVITTDQRIFTWYLPEFGMGFAVLLWKLERIPLVLSVAWIAAFALLGLITNADTSVQFAGCLTAFAIMLPLRSPVPFLGWLGGISYSLYLLHVPVGGKVVNLAARFEGTSLHILAIVVAFATSVIAAWIFWWVIEKELSAGIERVLFRHKRNPIEPTS